MATHSHRMVECTRNRGDPQTSLNAKFGALTIHLLRGVSKEQTVDVGTIVGPTRSFMDPLGVNHQALRLKLLQPSQACCFSFSISSSCMITCASLTCSHPTRQIRTVDYLRQMDFRHFSHWQEGDPQ